MCWAVYPSLPGFSDYDAWVLKLDGNGNGGMAENLWRHSSDYRQLDAIQQTTDGGYIVAGDTTSFGAGNLMRWLLKLDENGTVEWEKDLWRHRMMIKLFHSANRRRRIHRRRSYMTPLARAIAWVMKLDANGEMLGCPSGLIGTSSATTADTAVTPADTSATAQDTFIIPATLRRPWKVRR